MNQNQKRSLPRWVVFSAAAIIILAITFIILSLRMKSPEVDDRLQMMTRPDLEQEKLRQEVAKLQIENRRANSRVVFLVSNAGLLTTLLAIIGAIITIYKQLEERKKDRQQREAENLRRIDEKFAAIVRDLGSDSVPIQAGAAVSILTFLQPRYEAFYEQVYLIILANLKIRKEKREEATAELLLKAFEKAIRLLIEHKLSEHEPIELDLSHADLKRVNLATLDLRSVDLGFADLPGAVLEGANLFRARGYGANLRGARLSRANLNEARFKTAIFSDALFHDTNLVAANLKETDLQRAQLHQAQLQSAHFENADLRGAQFNQANVSDAYFKGALLDDAALKSILKSYHWDNAHFDEEIILRLENLAAAGN